MNKSIIYLLILASSLFATTLNADVSMTDKRITVWTNEIIPKNIITLKVTYNGAMTMYDATKFKIFVGEGGTIVTILTREDGVIEKAQYSLDNVKKFEVMTVKDGIVVGLYY